MKAFSVILTIVFTIALSITLVLMVQSCNKDLSKAVKEIDRDDQCIGGFVYKMHTNGKMRYQYLTNGQPVKCIKMEK